MVVDGDAHVNETEQIFLHYLIFGSDYPHGDRIPGTVRAFQERRDLPDGLKRKILGENARRLYRL